ncbi:MAG: hypothetical protein HY645_06495 [Acidobacteria bacterium]|nr:hypothetical protein [Acidobacteriota bacterium]
MTLIFYVGLAAALVSGALSYLQNTLSPHDSRNDLLQSADRILQEVSRIRELPVKQPFEKRVKSREEIRQYLIEKIKKEYPPDLLEVENKALVKLGLIPADLDLESFIIELLSEQVMGFYDPDADILYLADWVPLEVQEPVLAHEILHALQDQHFNLSTLSMRVKDNDDASSAYQAVVEGEGLAIMLDYLLRPSGRNFLQVPDIVALNREQLPMMDAQFKVFASAPPYLREILLFPYTYGVRFIQAFRQQHFWSEAHRLYKDPPKSTEQILHPEKYLSRRDDPTPVKTPKLLDGKWKRSYSNVLGEFTIYLLLRQFLEEETARLASEGWDGDRVELYESSGRPSVLVLATHWDSPEEAQQFFTAYKQVVSKKLSGSPRRSGDRQKEYWDTANGELSLSLKGSSVVVIEP